MTFFVQIHAWCTWLYHVNSFIQFSFLRHSVFFFFLSFSFFKRLLKVILLLDQYIWFTRCWRMVHGNNACLLWSPQWRKNYQLMGYSILWNSNTEWSLYISAPLRRVLLPKCISTCFSCCQSSTFFWLWGGRSRCQTFFFLRRLRLEDIFHSSRFLISFVIQQLIR